MLGTLETFLGHLAALELDEHKKLDKESEYAILYFATKQTLTSSRMYRRRFWKANTSTSTHFQYVHYPKELQHVDARCTS